MTPRGRLKVLRFEQHCINCSTKVNGFMQLEGYQNIFVAGDITNIAEEKLAERAIAHAKVLCNLQQFLLFRLPLRILLP